MSSIYEFQVNGADHKPYDLSQHKGHPLLIYNVASKCGYTKGGYETATELYNKYKDQGFTVLAFPCNQFMSQEPGTEEEVKEFACTRFSAEFPIMEKVHVNGGDEHPLYKYLKHAKKGVLGTTAIKWNFTSFLVDGEGKAVERFSPGTKASEIEKKLIPLLSASAPAGEGAVLKSTEESK
ncbi:glutathione peroxidase-type tryparedoxin peroxidase [Angomonas deanei]|nr:glutathione peroxidase-type tryparedoxin peroxidase [Angomonas deanei]|eukprot:EPY30453.1 glutathione peroxidase-type tryparedoxin peroxidase [Angomonas deanei]